MSGDGGYRFRGTPLLVALFLLCESVWAVNIPDVFEDPLYVMPPVLTDGVRLPGDDGPLACPATVNLTNALSLSDVIDLALCRNPQIRLAWASIKIQASALGEARAAYWPTLSGSTSYLQNRIHYPGSTLPETTNEGQTVFASLGWRLFDFGGRSANRKSANLLLTAALLSHDAALQKTLASVVSAYFDALTAQAVAQARSESAHLAERTVATTERRENKGVAAQSDTLQARTALAKAQLTEQRALGELRKAVSVLIYTMNLPPSTPIQLMSISEAPASKTRQDLEHWLGEASQHHPGILAARAQLDAAKTKINAVRSEGLPSIDFTGNYYRNGYPNQGLQTTKSDTTTWGLTLTVPFFEGFARTYKIRSAEAQAEQSAAQLADTERQILAEVVKAHADAVASLANLESSVKLLDAAQAALASSEKRYAKGAADILELLNQQASLADAQQERVRCLSEWQSARLRLMANTGVMGSIAARLPQ